MNACTNSTRILRRLQTVVCEKSPDCVVSVSRGSPISENDLGTVGAGTILKAVEGTKIKSLCGLSKGQQEANFSQRQLAQGR